VNGENRTYVSESEAASSENDVRTLVGCCIGPEAGQSDATPSASTAMEDISDSELLCRKQKKANLLDGLLDRENVVGGVIGSVPETTTVAPSAGGIPADSPRKVLIPGASKPVPLFTSGSKGTTTATPVLPPVGETQETTTPVSPLVEGIPAYQIEVFPSHFRPEVLLPATVVIPGTTPPVGKAQGTSTPPDEYPDQSYAESVLQAVRAFPLPADEPPRPVIGPPSLDHEMLLRRMEEL